MKTVVVEDEVRLSQKELARLLAGEPVDIETGSNIMGESLVIRVSPPRKRKP